MQCGRLLRPWSESDDCRLRLRENSEIETEIVGLNEEEESKWDGECCLASLWVGDKGEHVLGSAETSILQVVQFQETRRNIE